jgi:hypothetical protein
MKNLWFKMNQQVETVETKLNGALFQNLKSENEVSFERSRKMIRSQTGQQM